MPPEQVNRRGGHHPEDELTLHPDEQAFHGRVPLEGRRTDDPAHAVRERHEPHDPKRSRGGLGVGLDLRVQAPIEERRTAPLRKYHGNDEPDDADGLKVARFPILRCSAS